MAPPLKGAAGRRVCGHFRLHLFVCFSSFFVVWSHLGQAVVSLGGDFWTRVPQVYRLCPFFCHILFVFVYLGHFRSHFLVQLYRCGIVLCLILVICVPSYPFETHCGYFLFDVSDSGQILVRLCRLFVGV